MLTTVLTRIQANTCKHSRWVSSSDQPYPRCCAPRRTAANVRGAHGATGELQGCAPQVSVERKFLGRGELRQDYIRGDPVEVSRTRYTFDDYGFG